jgi:heme/copper-type cytochrome/quinol oxidase subunit 2
MLNSSNAESLLSTIMEENFDLTYGSSDEEMIAAGNLELEPLPGDAHHQQNAVNAEADAQERPKHAWGSLLFLFTYTMYAIAVMCATTAVLARHRDTLKRCDQPMGMWLTIHACVIGFGLVVRLWCFINNTYFPRREGQEANFFMRLQSQWAELLLKMFNLLLFVWIVIGLVWTFSSVNCKKNAPEVYNLAFSVLIIDVIVIGVVCIIFVIFVTTISLLYWGYQRAAAENGLDQQAGATPEMLSSLEAPIEFGDCMFCIIFSSFCFLFLTFLSLLFFHCFSCFCSFALAFFIWFS